MAITKAQLRKWFDNLKGANYDYMLVYVDEFYWEDYPVGVYTQDYWEKRHELDARGMQRFMESYDLHADPDEQLRVFRVDRFHVEQASPTPIDIEALSARLHDIYQKEAHRRGDVRHLDDYAELSEDVKEWDRVARWIVEHWTPKFDGELPPA